MRTEARIKCSIWGDQDYLKLPVEAKLLYQFLLEQDDLSLCGVIPLREVRWEGPLGIASLPTFLEILAKAQFLVIDYTEGECCVRTFMRHDGVLKSPNIVKGARNALGSVHSAKIRAALAAEYPELARDWGLDTPSDTPSDPPPGTLLSRTRMRRTEVGGRGKVRGTTASLRGNGTLRGPESHRDEDDDEPKATAGGAAPRLVVVPEPEARRSPGKDADGSGFICPSCGKGQLRDRTNPADDHAFIACSRFPACKWVHPEHRRLSDLRRALSPPEPEPLPDDPATVARFDAIAQRIGEGMRA